MQRPELVLSESYRVYYWLLTKAGVDDGEREQTPHIRHSGRSTFFDAEAPWRLRGVTASQFDKFGLDSSIGSLLTLECGIAGSILTNVNTLWQANELQKAPSAPVVVVIVVCAFDVVCTLKNPFSNTDNV